MRVKSIIAVVGLGVMTAVVAVPGVSNANRGTSEPVVQPSVEAPADPVDEVVPETPVVGELPGEPVAETPAAEPVADQPDAPAAPVEEAPVVSKRPTTPVVETPPAVDTTPPDLTVVTIEPEAAPPAADKGHDEGDAQKPADPCHMDSYEPRTVDSFDSAGEAARAEKVDRNGNGTVCRKDIPGHGRGNTGEGSNIKDDQAR
jgi:hypothetical protein